jgi:nitrous oxidase accessory protein
MRRLWVVGLVLCWVGLVVLPVVAQDDRFDLTAALATAQPGATIVVPAGTYPGPFMIDKPVTLVGQDWPVIQGSGKGDVLTVNAADVTLHGLVIRGSGDSLDRENAGVTGLAPRLTVENSRLEDVLFGIYLKEAPNSIIRNNVIASKALELGRRGDGIRVWYSAGTLVEGNHVQGSRDVIMWFSPDGIVRNNLVEGGRYGLHFMFSDNQVVEGNTLHHNSVGAFLMYGRGLTLRNNLIYENHGPSGYGVGLKDVDDIVAEGNRFVANRIGVYVDNSPREPSATVRFAQNLFAYNETGLELLPLVKHNTYTANLFQENGEQMAIAGGGTLSDNAWSEAGVGNYWSDYAGFDATGDNIGDLPYHSQSLYEDLMESQPELRLFQLSPASDALDLAAQAFPIFQPRPKLTDDHPLTVPPTLPASNNLPTPPVTSNVIAAVGLLLLALLIVGSTRIRVTG